MATTQQAHEARRRAADRVERTERPHDGLDFARGLLLAVALSVPLWAIVVAVVLLALSR